MDKDLQKRINEAFDGLLGDSVEKAQKDELDKEDDDIEKAMDNDPDVEMDDEDDDDEMVEKACATLKKGKFSNTGDMLKALQKAGYSKAICTKAMNRFKSKAVKKALDAELDIEDFDDDKEIDATELLESIPGMFDEIETRVSKGFGDSTKIQMAVVKALKVIGYAVAEQQEKQNELLNLVKSIGKMPVEKGIKGGYNERKFEAGKESISKALTVENVNEIQNALLEINTFESREALRSFATSKDINVVKGFKKQIEDKIGIELKFE
jgi:hypothetical protein